MIIPIDTKESFTKFTSFPDQSIEETWKRKNVPQHNKAVTLWLLLAVKEMRIKTTLRLYLIPVRFAIIRKTRTNAGEDVVIKERSFIVDGNVN
jgi:hypothetical protein